MKLLNELTLKNLRLNKKRSFMTVIGIMLSIALMFTVITMVFSLRNVMQDIVISDAGKYHIKTVEGAKYRDSIAVSREVSEYTELKVLGNSKIDSKNKYKPYIKVFAADQAGFENSGLKLTEGRFPKSGDEIVLGKHIVENGGIQVKLDQSLKLVLGERQIKEVKDSESNEILYKDGQSLKGEFVEGEFLVNPYEKEYKVVGFVERPNSSIESYDQAGYSAFTFSSPQDRVIEEDIYYSLKDPKNIEKHVQVLYGDNISDCEVNTHLLSSMGIGLHDNRMNMIYSLAAILLVVIVATSVFIIKNSFSISIVEKTKQYGILKSLGATDSQVKRNIIFEGFTLGIIASVLGIALGLLASFILIFIVNNLLSASLNGFAFKLSLNPIAFAGSLILGFITIYLSVYFIARRSINFSPIEAIKSSNDIKIRKKDVKTPRIIDKLFDIGGLIAYKNLRRNRRKYRTTVASIALSVAVFIGMYSFVDTMVVGSKAAYSYTNYQISNFFYSEADLVDKNFEESKELLKILEADEKYAVYKAGKGNITSDSFTKEYLDKAKEMGFEKEGYTIVKIREINNESFDKLLEMNGLSKDSNFLFINKGEISEEGKITSYKILSDNNIKLTPKIYENTETGKLDDGKAKDKALSLTAITKLLPGMQEYNKGFSFEIYARENSLSDVLTFEGSEFFVDSPNADRTYKKLDDYIKEKGLGDFDIQNNQEAVKMINNILLLIQIFGYGFIIVISLIGLTNVFNTITSNVYSRKVEFGSLMSYGMSQGQINRMALFESMMIGGKGLLFGIPIGLIISFLSNKAMNLNIVISYRFPFLPIVISIVLVGLLTFIIMSYSVSQIKKQNIIETIRNENI